MLINSAETAYWTPTKVMPKLSFGFFARMKHKEIAKSVIDIVIRRKVTVFRTLFESRLPAKKAKVGVHGMEETPVPIPNTEAKLHSGYNTWFLSLGR